MQNLLMLACTQVGFVHLKCVFGWPQCWVILAKILNCKDYEASKRVLLVLKWKLWSGGTSIPKDQYGSLASSCTLSCSVSALENAGKPVSRPILVCQYILAHLKRWMCHLYRLQPSVFTAYMGCKNDSVFINEKEHFWKIFTLHVLSGSIT